MAPKIPINIELYCVTYFAHGVIVTRLVTALKSFLKMKIFYVLYSEKYSM